METKFTKGKWCIGDVNTKIVGTNKPDIKYIAICDQDKDIYNEEAEANAKLIASAPCLLEALQYIINDIKPEDACRGKFESFEKLKAYVGSKRMPTDEAILRCIEDIKKATE